MLKPWGYAFERTQAAWRQRRHDSIRERAEERASPAFSAIALSVAESIARGDYDPDCDETQAIAEYYIGNVKHRQWLLDQGREARARKA